MSRPDVENAAAQLTTLGKSTEVRTYPQLLIRRRRPEVIGQLEEH
jgi:hypothetical protein